MLLLGCPPHRRRRLGSPAPTNCHCLPAAFCVLISSFFRPQLSQLQFTRPACALPPCCFCRVGVLAAVAGGDCWHPLPLPAAPPAAPPANKLPCIFPSRFRALQSSGNNGGPVGRKAKKAAERAAAAAKRAAVEASPAATASAPITIGSTSAADSGDAYGSSAREAQEQQERLELLRSRVGMLQEQLQQLMKQMGSVAQASTSRSGACLWPWPCPPVGTSAALRPSTEAALPAALRPPPAWPLTQPAVPAELPLLALPGLQVAEGMRAQLTQQEGVSAQLQEELAEATGQRLEMQEELAASKEKVGGLAGNIGLVGGRRVIGWAPSSKYGRGGRPRGKWLAEIVEGLAAGFGAACPCQSSQPAVAPHSPHRCF